MRHLLSTADLDRASAVALLDTAEEMAATQSREIKKLPTLRGRTVVNLFFEDSTRTRISFEAAAKRLSADVINFAAKGSSVSKGESLKDTAQTLQAMGADAVVIRHPASGAPHRLAHAGWIDVPVVNAGDGTHQHPTQALLDAYTIRRHLAGRVGDDGGLATSTAPGGGPAAGTAPGGGRGESELSAKETAGGGRGESDLSAPGGGGGGRGRDLGGLHVVVVGDVLHSRVARSNVDLLTTLGARVTLVAPPTLVPVGAGAWPATVRYDLDEAVAQAPDAVMMLRVQRERMSSAGGGYFPSPQEYHRQYGLTGTRLAALPDHTIVMHPGPMNRGLEISAEAADSSRSTILEQVANGVSVRMAVLYQLLAGAPAPTPTTQGAHA